LHRYLLSDEGGLGAAHLLADGDGNTPGLMARLEGYGSLADYLDAAAAERGVRGASRVGR
jgi:hypothetical protein